MWVRRNPGLARSLAAILVLLVVGLGISLHLQGKARSQEAIAVEERANVMRLSAFRDLETLIGEADDVLWPPHPEHQSAYVDWLAEANRLKAGLDPDPESDDPGHLAVLEELRAKALPPEAGEETGDDPTYRFANVEDGWWHERLVELIQGIEDLFDEDTGLVSGISPVHGWGIARRYRFACEIEERTRTGDDARASWEFILNEMKSIDAYAGLELSPQLGLLPIGVDPDSGLAEFWHVQSGDPPGIGTDGYVLAEETGLVFVLIPTGEFTMGAQSEDPDAPYYDEFANDEESPPHTVPISAFFLSKYEMTQGQWIRLNGTNPSLFQRAVGNQAGQTFDDLHPVEHLSWSDCDTALRRAGLILPSEAQWEYAARGGKRPVWTAWWTGDDPMMLEGAANVADRAARRGRVPREWTLNYEDYYVLHAPVGRFMANPFGLHDVHGNVMEWCRDWYDGGFYASRETWDPDPVCLTSPHMRRPLRGGDYHNDYRDTRSATRIEHHPSIAFPSTGVRPARAIDP